MFTDTSNRLETTVSRLLDAMSTQSTQLNNTQHTQHELLDQIQLLRAELQNGQVQQQDLKNALQELREQKQKIVMELNSAKGKQAFVRWSGEGVLFL